MRTKRKRTKGAVSWVEFNINYHVYVKLNKVGHECLRKNHDAVWAGVKRENVPDYAQPQEDGCGWSRWQLWKLMQEFGPYINLGELTPFDTTIRIEEDNLY